MSADGSGVEERSDKGPIRGQLGSEKGKVSGNGTGPTGTGRIGTLNRTRNGMRAGCGGVEQIVSRLWPALVVYKWNGAV